MTRMTGPDCAVMCNVMNTHARARTHTRSRWSWARTTDGRAASGNGYHRAHGGPTGDEGSGSTTWNITVPARFLTRGG